VISVIEQLQKLPNVESKHLERYQFSEVRKFLIQHNWSLPKTISAIHRDISWREETLPIGTIELLWILMSKSVYLMGSDLQMCPNIYLHLN